MNVYIKVFLVNRPHLPNNKSKAFKNMKRRKVINWTKVRLWHNEPTINGVTKEMKMKYGYLKDFQWTFIKQFGNHFIYKIQK